MTTVSLPIASELIGTVAKGPDLDIRVRVLAVDNAEFIDVREYIPSTDVYGRGIVLPRDAVKGLVKLLREA